LPVVCDVCVSMDVEIGKSGDYCIPARESVGMDECTEKEEKMITQKDIEAKRAELRKEFAYCEKCGRPRDVAIAGPGKSRWWKWIEKWFFGE